MAAKSSKYNGSNKNPYSSISAKDFERMCKSVDKAFSQLGKATDKGVAGAQAAQQAAYQNKLVKSRFRSSTGLTVSGAIMAFIGGMGVFALGNVAMVAVMAGLAFGSGASSDIAAVIMLSGIAVAFFALYLPLLPVRRWLTAAFAAHERRRKAPAIPEIPCRKDSSPRLWQR